jgi:DNA invertase Pin-like site-specific DNA recombinase
MAEFIAYYRVSTDRQGASGLGLAAQRAAMARFIGAGQLVAEYTEVESGKQHSNRPQLLAALADCRKRRAMLLIARLDRLSRNVAFIANLMESGADFVAVDMPQATGLTIHILAAVAEHEREMISTRTKRPWPKRSAGAPSWATPASQRPERVPWSPITPTGLRQRC